jgi:hypothetical protein
VNYDTVLVALARLTEAPPAVWSSDRAGGERIRPPVPDDAVKTYGEGFAASYRR